MIYNNITTISEHKLLSDSYVIYANNIINSKYLKFSSVK